MAVQYAVGFSAFLLPQWTQANRAELAPVHAFLGMLVFGGGAAVMATGIQEKATFVQLVAKPASVYSGVMRVPVALVLLVLLTTAAVLFHHVPTAAARRWQQVGDTGFEDPASAAGAYETPDHLASRTY